MALSMSSPPRGRRQSPRFRHEALLYDGEPEFVAATAAFSRDAVAAGEPILVVVSARKIDRLRAELGDEAAAVTFADMAEVGRNPARIIPAWQEFVAGHARWGQRLRGVGEPIWADRSPAELVECQHHETLLNVAFDDGPPWWLLCPYDTGALDAAVVAEARRSHPLVLQAGTHRHSADYRVAAAAAAPFDGPLPEPPVTSPAVVFDAGAEPLPVLRRFVSRAAAHADLDAARAADLVLAVNELVTNSLHHGGGSGVLRAWRQGDALVCEVRDRGRIDEPLVGREHPRNDSLGGRGLWLVNQLCDLVQVRSSDDGTAVRVYMTRE